MENNESTGDSDLDDLLAHAQAMLELSPALPIQLRMVADKDGSHPMLIEVRDSSFDELPNSLISSLRSRVFSSNNRPIGSKKIKKGNSRDWWAKKERKIKKDGVRANRKIVPGFSGFGKEGGFSIADLGKNKLTAHVATTYVATTNADRAKSGRDNSVSATLESSDPVENVAKHLPPFVRDATRFVGFSSSDSVGKCVILWNTRSLRMIDNNCLIAAKSFSLFYNVPLIVIATIPMEWKTSLISIRESYGLDRLQNMSTSATVSHIGALVDFKKHLCRGGIPFVAAFVAQRSLCDFITSICEHANPQFLISDEPYNQEITRILELLCSKGIASCGFVDSRSTVLPSDVGSVVDFPPSCDSESFYMKYGFRLEKMRDRKLSALRTVDLRVDVLYGKSEKQACGCGQRLNNCLRNARSLTAGIVRRTVLSMTQLDPAAASPVDWNLAELACVAGTRVAFNIPKKNDIPGLVGSESIVFQTIFSFVNALEGSAVAEKLERYSTVLRLANGAYIQLGKFVFDFVKRLEMYLRSGAVSPLVVLFLAKSRRYSNLPPVCLGWTEDLLFQNLCVKPEANLWKLLNK
jgi:hypothetical protein